MDPRLEDIIENIKGIWNTHESVRNDHILDKLYNHIKHQLPTIIKTYHDAHQMREERKKSLETMSDEYTETFLNKNKYYYNHAIELFFQYDNIKYSIINEDDIHHKILSDITQNYEQLIAWKYKIKNIIVKRIKERDLLKSIPESKTIQNVINVLIHVIFQSRDHAKYFLTIIGDIILKKNTNIYLINPKAKSFIKSISQEGCALFGVSNIMTTFKLKYYDHAYDDCRLIDFLDSVSTFDTSIIQRFKEVVIDFFCVAAHYSQRFLSADDFLRRHCKVPSLKSHALFLKNNTEMHIIETFLNYATEPTPSSNNCFISWKNMLYLWKVYIDEHRLPNVFFNNALKMALITYCEKHGGNAIIDDAGAGAGAGSPVLSPVTMSPTTPHSELKGIKYSGQHNDVFLNITSKYLPIVNKFISFWSELLFVSDEEIELEIDELSTIFNNYLCFPNQQTLTQGTQGQQCSDHAILGLVRHYYPDISIEDDKYLINVGCKLWDKKNHLLGYLDKYRITTDSSQQKTPLPLYNAYEEYCSEMYTNSANAVSKRYFEKFFNQNYPAYVNKDGFISVDWWV